MEDWRVEDVDPGRGFQGEDGFSGDGEGKLGCCCEGEEEGELGEEGEKVENGWHFEND
jgi:hypothetical protein